ncbi:MAG: hypothetical protein WCI01_09120 [Chlorobiaceae bacterium]
MEDVIKTCPILEEVHDDIHLKHCLWTGVVVSYARSFGENTGISSLPKEFREFPDPDMQTQHNKLLEFRNLIFAHRNVLKESTMFDESIPIEELNTMKVTYEQSIVKIGIYRSSFEKIKVRHTQGLAEFQKKRIDIAISKALDSMIVSGEIIPGINEFRIDKK